MPHANAPAYIYKPAEEDSTCLGKGEGSIYSLLSCCWCHSHQYKTAFLYPVSFANSTYAADGDGDWHMKPLDVFSSSHSLSTTISAHDIKWRGPQVDVSPSLNTTPWSMPGWCGGSRSARTLPISGRNFWDGLGMIVLATCLGNQPAVLVWTGKTVRFGSRPVQKPDPQLIGGSNPHLYPSTRGLCRVWLYLSVPISSFHFRVFLFMVAVRYIAVMCKILALVHHSLYLSHWLPL